MQRFETTSGALLRVNADEPRLLSEKLKAAFPGACVAGCSTAGEIASGKMMTGSVVAMFFSVDTVEDAAVAVIENLRSEAPVGKAFAEFERHFGFPPLPWTSAATLGWF